MKETHVQDNTESRERLIELVSGLGVEDLAATVGNGMTVAAVLVHLAYWDEYCVALLRQWERDGLQVSRGNLEVSNAALAAVAAAVPPEAAVRLATLAAQHADACVSQLDPALVEAIEQGQATRIMNRAGHRRAHLDQIEAAIATARAGA